MGSFPAKRTNVGQCTIGSPDRDWFMFIADSGDIAEETTTLDVLCLTLCDNTERPETFTIGMDELKGTDPSKLPPALTRLMAGQWKKGAIPLKWDGKAAERIVEHLELLLGNS